MGQKFREIILDKIAKSSVPQKMEEEGFFGFKPKHSDVESSIDGNNVLIECKVINNDNICEVRNGLGQLIEYLKEGKWRAGVLAVFDKRQSATKFFCNNSKNELFAKKFSMKDYFDKSLREIEVAIFHIYQENGNLAIEPYYIS